MRETTTSVDTENSPQLIRVLVLDTSLPSLDLGSIAIIALFQIDKSACPNILDYNDSATCIGCDKSPELILIIGGSSTPRPSLDAGSVTTVALCEIEQR
jgi:hypothetical protein